MNIAGTRMGMTNPPSSATGQAFQFRRSVASVVTETVIQIPFAQLDRYATKIS